MRHKIWLLLPRTLTAAAIVMLALMITVLANVLPVYFLVHEPLAWVALLVICIALAVAVGILSQIEGRKIGTRIPEVAARIDQAQEAMENTARLVDELQAEMGAKAAALKRVQAEAAQFERLASVRKEEAKAVTNLVESVIAGTHAKLDRKNNRSQLLFFVSGLLCSVPIGVLVNLWTK